MHRTAAALLVSIVLFPPSPARSQDSPGVPEAREAALAALGPAADRLADLAGALLAADRGEEAARVARLSAAVLGVERELRALLPAAPAAGPEPAAPPEPEPPDPPDWIVPPFFAGRLPDPGFHSRPHPRTARGMAATEDAMHRALVWLANHQDPDGGFDGAGFMKHDTVAPVSDGAGSSLHDVGLTGLALLAFLGAGETPHSGAHAETVRRGLRWLRSTADPEGCFGWRTTGKFVYDHALATLAMVEAYGLSGSPALKEAAQKGVDFIGKCQNPYLAWRYGVRPQDNDTCVSGFMVHALFAARAVRLEIDAACFDGMKAWLDKVTEPEYGRAGYTARGTGPDRPPDRARDFPADRSESLTAIGIFSRVLLGEDPRKSEPILRGTELLLKCLPLWDTHAGSIDFVYWLYGSLAIAQAGGEPWKIWWEALRTALLDHQRKDPASFKGSWDPVDPWGAVGGRIYATALCALALESPYRYPRLFPGRPGPR
ncbi:MAG: terpene cyclase/mutase family protein [Planctomycetes bacterium]|nr:terpene cyclase/mutase family protein [Planctomycetota bacterium]